MACDLIVCTDGASRGNPGKSAIGVVITDVGQAVLEEFGQAIGDGTNNQAEYKAVIAGLKAAGKHTRGFVELRSDSQLIIRQLNRQNQTLDEPRRLLQEEVRRAELPFAGVPFAWVPRETPGSARADARANAALDRLG